VKSYLISYDLDKPGQNYSGLIDRLKQLGAVKILYSEWVLRTTSTAVQLRDDLKRFIDANDMLLVVALTGEAAWTKLMIDSASFKETLAA
jgi:CRISPR/Cas system-associated endoribonuclease Cas2